jgi:transcriptional regulator with XRE-family HTH domain
MNIGKIIKQARQDKNLKQKEFSIKCKISVTYLSQIENNKKEPALSTLQDISQALSIPLPLIFFMSLEENDVPENKKEFFKYIHPSLNGLIKEFF